MAESVNKKLLSALTEGHEKELRSSARRISKKISNSTALDKSSGSGTTVKSPKIQKSTVSDSGSGKRKFSFSFVAIQSHIKFFFY